MDTLGRSNLLNCDVGFVVDENVNSDVKAKFDEILDSVSKELKESSVLHTLALSKVKDKVFTKSHSKKILGKMCVSLRKLDLLADLVRTAD